MEMTIPIRHQRLGIDTRTAGDLSSLPMTLLHEAVDSKKFDTRVVERNLERGLIQPKDVEKAIKELPDDSDNADYTDLNELADNGED